MGSEHRELITHPEIELRRKVIGNEFHLMFSPYIAQRTALDILELHKDGEIHKKTSIGHEEFAAYCDTCSLSTRSVEPSLRIIFIDDIVLPNTFGPPGINPDRTANLLHERFGVSTLFLRDLHPSSLYKATGSATFLRTDETGERISLDGFYRLMLSTRREVQRQYCSTWFSQTLLCGRASTYVIFNCSASVKSILREYFEIVPPNYIRPFAIEGFLLDESITIMSVESEKYMHSLYHIEFSYHDYGPHIYMENEESQALEVVKLHIIASSCRMLQGYVHATKDTLEFIIDAQKRYSDLVSPVLPEHSHVIIGPISESFAMLRLKTKWLIELLQGQETRATLKIDLHYNLQNQRDSKVNLEIARLTAKIAAVSQKDSSSMITMAALTMFFLPGTFVSAIFSMVFFDTSPDSSGDSSFRVSSSWWLYFAVTIPLTVLVFAVWIVWQKYREVYGNPILEEILTPGGNVLERGTGSLIVRHKSVLPTVHVIDHHSPLSVSVNEPIGLDAKSIGTSGS